MGAVCHNKVITSCNCVKMSWGTVDNAYPSSAWSMAGNAKGNWSCALVQGSWLPGRVNPETGIAECLAYDGSSCLWGQTTESGCFSVIASLTPSTTVIPNTCPSTPSPDWCADVYKQFGEWAQCWPICMDPHAGPHRGNNLVTALYDVPRFCGRHFLMPPLGKV